MAVIDEIRDQLRTLEESVKNNQSVDWEKLTADFETKQKAYVDEQIKEKLDTRPVRRVPGALIGENGVKVDKSNRYFKHLLAFEKDGYLKFGEHKLQPVDLFLAYNLMEKGHTYYPDKIKAPSKDLDAALKALTSTGVGTGDEFVPTEMAATIWEDIFLATRVADTIMTIPMPTDPFDVPVGIGNITWRKATQGQPTTPSDASTNKATLTSTELITEQQWTYTLDEDSILALMPLMRAEITRSGAEIIDDFVVNADSTDAATGNINSDDQNPPDDRFYLSNGQDGLRHLWLVDNTGQNVDAGGDALADADIVNVLGKLDKYGADPSRLVMIGDVQTYLKGFLSSASGAPGSNLLTLDKFGPNAILLTGQIAAYRGVPLITSAVHRLAPADGKLDAATPANNTLGSLTVFNRDFWKKGFRRQLMIEMDRDIRSRMMIMVTSMRLAVAARTRSSAQHTAGVRNILV
jgi:HK97 family phage major capsid protein